MDSTHLTPIDTGSQNDAFTPVGRTFGLREIQGALQRRLRLITLSFLVFGGSTLSIMMLQPPVYTATSTIMINTGQDRVLNDQQALNTTTSNSAAVDSEAEVLRSPQLAKMVVDALHFVSNPNWNSALRPTSTVQQARNYVQQELSRLFPAQFPSPRRETGRNDANAVAASLSQAVSVERRGLSYVIDISVAAPSAQEAARVANSYVQVYLNLLVDAQNATSVRATGWLGDRLRELQRDVEQKESAVAAYRTQSGLLLQTGTSLDEQRIREVQSSVLQARADLAEKQARYRQVQRLINDGSNPDTVGDALSSQVIRDLRRQEAELSSRQSEMETQLGQRHPDVINGRNQIADIRSQIDAEAQRIVTGMQNDVEVANARLASLQSTLSSVSGSVAESNSASVQLEQLMREATAARTVYESFLQRYHEIAGQGQIAAAQVRVVSSAAPPTKPTSPNLQIALIVALGVGLLGAVALAAFAEMTTDNILDIEDLETRVGVQALISVPTVSPAALRLLAPNDRHPAGYLVDKPMSGYAEAFRVLRTTISFASVDQQTQVVAVTSALADEGKTTCALSLARIASLGGQRVILLDCDLRRHALNAFLDIEPSFGLLQVLSGERTWQDATGYDESTKLHVLPVASTHFTPRDVFDSQAMRRLLQDLKAHYDLIVLDCPPVWAVADARVLAALSDTTIFTSLWAKTPVKALARAIHQLSLTGVHVLGVVINRANPRLSDISGSYSNVAARYYVS